jgi:hypothetical protein
MKCLYSHDNPFFVYNIRNILVNNNIQCEVRNEIISSAAGELPPTEVWPEIWVIREQDYKKSEELLAESLAGDLSGISWFCEHCNETNPPAFELCWQCGEDSKKTDNSR